eukprot:COSAG02_NODE_2733_length_8136_cov_35.604454_2_plen_37_part_00
MRVVTTSKVRSCHKANVPAKSISHANSIIAYRKEDE